MSDLLKSVHTKHFRLITQLMSTLKIHIFETEPRPLPDTRPLTLHIALKVMVPSSCLRVIRTWLVNSAHWVQTKMSKFNQIPLFKHKPKKMKTVRHCNLKTTISRRRGNGRDTWDQEPNIPSFNHSNGFSEALPQILQPVDTEEQGKCARSPAVKSWEVNTNSQGSVWVASNKHPWVVGNAPFLHAFSTDKQWRPRMVRFTVRRKIDSWSSSRKYTMLRVMQSSRPTERSTVECGWDDYHIARTWRWKEWSPLRHSRQFTTVIHP